MKDDEQQLSPEAQHQLALEERAARAIARVRANRRFMAGIKDAANERTRGERGTPVRDLKRKDG